MDLNNFEKPIIRKDFEAISKEVQEHKEKSADKEMPGKEAVSSVLRARIQQSKAAEPQPQKDTLPGYLRDSAEEIQSKVKDLVSIALEKGIDDSIKEAQRYGPFILDALHDALTTKVYEDLKQKGRLR